MTKETKGLATITAIYIIFLIFPLLTPLLGFSKSLRMAIPMGFYIFLFLLGTFVLRHKLKENFSRIWQHKLKSLGIIVLVFLAMTVLDILGVLITQFGYSLLNITQTSLTNDSNIGKVIEFLPLPLVILVLGILGPFVEEIIFRYILFNFLKKYCPVGVAILLSSLCFALIHVKHFTVAELLGVLPHFASGLVFAYTYHKTDNLLFSSAVHIFYNTSAFLLI